MDSYRVAKRRPAMAQLIARTDGRTNERPTHLLEISSVLNRTGEIEVFHRSDMDFTEFVSTRSKQHVLREGWVDPIRRTLLNRYDQETERLRMILRQDRRAA